ncbi:hypothetical protein GGR50DRAFT_637287 [Xylaria sp. CBS 124048]|nr:hypothetical protein GGR50DRAFT_637287 [Xylaria sp. CBS 124048]
MTTSPKRLYHFRQNSSTLIYTLERNIKSKRLITHAVTQINMPVRIPAPRGSETAVFGLAGLAGFAPFNMMIPGAKERMASQTARWAPRWERSITRVANPAERIAQRVEPPAARTVKTVSESLRLEKMALGVDRRIRGSINRFNRVF